ncbi:hypothetical protein IV38_GL000307 [Lactobacillus selangorensis]|uniref:Lipopolysaccharide assembly protein A domain-containing protein n=1 Tax=Lactobacillus selangorensis TaxID=81857 RepID=A0A0R2FLB3_9LACO|nr:LapA family protein [Lactobacillus selangorensis]KRN29423.1 hypothetical protein IV38_GL000307 [Lactobacillus selangorensis]KRN34048.1 hypothetical protein IV40_GL000361 [Lactobacillus selangorensis]
MKNQGKLVLGLLLTLIIVVFAVLNVAPVKINFGFAEVKWPLIIIIIGSLLIGAIITALVSTSTSVAHRKEQKKLQQQLKEAQGDQQKQLQEQVQKQTKQYKDQIARKNQEIKGLKAQIAQADVPDDGPNNLS